jgi:hypothetical protein
MDVYEALDQLERMYDNSADMMCDEDLEVCCNAFEVLYQFIQKYEPRVELPLEFTCTCGEHLVRSDIYADMSRFFCPVCESEWLVGPQEV